MNGGPVETRDATLSSRRHFLKLSVTAAIGGGLTLGFGLPVRGEIRDTLTRTRHSRRMRSCASIVQARSRS
jgi:hypothetical protein